MTILTNIPPFTVFQDVRVDLLTGWSVFYQAVVNTLAGDDILTGSGGEFGVGVGGLLDTSLGHDSIEGSGIIGIYVGGTIQTGLGNDTLNGYGKSCGIQINNGFINTGAGNDIVSGVIASPTGRMGCS